MRLQVENHTGTTAVPGVVPHLGCCRWRVRRADARVAICRHAIGAGLPRAPAVRRRRRVGRGPELEHSEVEAGADAMLGLHPDGAAHQLSQPPRDGQPQSCRCSFGVSARF